MTVNLEITFSPEEIKAMVLERLKNVETHVEGTFSVHCQYGYLPPVTATFVPRHSEETVQPEPLSIDGVEPPAVAMPCAADFHCDPF